MEWNNYKAIYRNFEFSISQSMVMTLVSHEVLGEWPKSLPEKIQKPLASARKKWGELWTARFDDKITSSQLDDEIDGLISEMKNEGLSPLFGAAIQMHIYRPNLESSEIDFNRIVNSQAYVMAFAHMDAFITDSFRAICRVRPEVMKSEKKIEWADIISCGSWDKLLTHLIEQSSFQFGWQSVLKRLEFLRNQIGLTISITEEQLRLIDDAELIRNVLVHNGGSVSQEFLERSKRTDLNLGEQIPLTIDSTRNIIRTISELGNALYKSVAKKFYDKDNPEWI